jgi:long-chain acyl-CoA synthetase
VATDPKSRGLITLLDGPASSDPERTALIFGDERVSYAGLAAATRSCAAGLRRAGAAPGWRIPVADDASLLAVAAVLGAPRMGAVAALMNPRLTPGELADLIHTAQTAPLGVAGPRYADALARAMDRPVFGPELTSTAADDLTTIREPEPDTEAVVLFTSGTTGSPKAVPITHGVLAPRIAAFAPAFDPAIPPSISLMCVPLVHIGGTLGLFVSLARANTTVALTRFDAGEWLALVARHRVNTSFLVPTMLHRILEHPDFATSDLSSLTEITYGAAPASPDLIRAAMTALPTVAFSNVFGQTETLGSITALSPADHAAGKLASVGRPLPGVEVRVVDPVTGEDLATSTVGELWVKTAASVAAPPETAGPRVDPGWLRTGDMVSVDGDGYIYPAGRLSDTINRGGEKFAPAEVEAALATHPRVRDVAVGGYPDPEMGQRVGAAVVAPDPVSAEELRDHCRGRVADFKLPERIVFVEEIPYNDFGKVARKALANVLAGETGR